MRVESAKGTKILHYLAAVIALPAIPFYWLSYRLLGKRCFYHWPETDVRPAGQVSRNEFLFTRLFPALLLVAIFGLAWWLIV